MSYLHMNMDRGMSRVNDQPLTLEQIAQYAPSAMATHAHSSRSERYTYIPTIDVIKGMMKAGFHPYSASQSRSRVEGKEDFTKHMIRFRHQMVTARIPANRRFLVGEMVPEVILVNAHDGTSSYKLFGGIFRFVCTNGLFVADSTVGSINVMHKGNIVGDVVLASNQIIEASFRSIDAVASWSQITLTDPEALAFAESVHHVRFADSEGKITTPITARQLLRPRRNEDEGNDLWKTFNRVQENAIQGGLHGVQLNNGQHRRVTTRTVKGIDQDVKLNRAMWQLAEKMAELKQGKAA